MDIFLSIVVTLILTIVNGFFSASELAVVSAKKAILEPESEEGDKRAAKALAISSNSGDFLATIQVAITLVGFASSAFAATSLSEPFGAALAGIGIPASISRAIATVLITLIVSYFSIVIGELVPKRLALSNPEGVAKAVAGPIGAFMAIVKPLVWLTSKSAEGITKLMGIKNPDDNAGASEDEIKYLVTDSDELTEEEKSMIHDVIELGDTKAREVMIPRVDMTAVEDTASLSEVLSIMRETGFSRLPVYHDSIDRVVGIAHIKDLLEPILDNRNEVHEISRYMRDCNYVPDTKDIIPLLSEMRGSHEQMVIVVDEYGGTAGVITIEDIVEEVVGEIEDEFDPDNKYLTQLSDREWLVDGRYSVDDAIELGWPIEDSEEYETLAGFVLEVCDRLPRPGDVFEREGYTFHVQSMRGRRVSLVRVTAPEQLPQEENNNLEQNDE